MDINAIRELMRKYPEQVVIFKGKHEYGAIEESALVIIRILKGKCKESKWNGSLTASHPSLDLMVKELRARSVSYIVLDNNLKVLGSTNYRNNRYKNFSSSYGGNHNLVSYNTGNSFSSSYSGDRNLESKKKEKSFVKKSSNSPQSITVPNKSSAIITHEQHNDNRNINDPIHEKKKCDYCKYYKRGDCGGVAVCADYTPVPRIDNYEKSLWPTEGDASYIRKHGRGRN